MDRLQLLWSHEVILLSNKSRRGSLEQPGTPAAGAAHVTP